MNRIIAGLFLLVLFSCMVYLSGKYAVANTYLYNAQQALSVQRPDMLPSASQIARAQRLIHQALLHAPNDPDNLDLAGRIYYLDALGTATGNEQTSLLQLAKRFHSGALAHRQYWPYSHVNMVFAKSALGEFDAGYDRHFEQAYQLGFDDRAVIRDLLYLGINDWQQTGPSLRQLTLTLAQTALQQRILSPNRLRTYFASRTQLIRFCAGLRQFEEKIELCNRS